MNSHPTAMVALLVGIDQYASPTIRDLGGCVNDVDAMEQLLRDKFNVPPANIKKLTNREATHQAIKAAFREHLIARAQAWVQAGRPEPAPAFVFHYSGHGSQALDANGLEPDGLDETLVPHDSRLNDVYDLKDWELGQLIDELAAPFPAGQANITLILDCCHSGSGTRDPEPTLVATRRCEPDLRPQPNQRPQPSQGPPGVGATRSLSPASGWELGGNYVLLAGCRDREEANEYIAPQGQAGYRQHGAMTYFLLQELSRLSPGRPLTYRELHERVRYQVNSRYESQMPQCEGQRDRTLFGGLAPERAVTLSVVEITGLIWVDGGLAHGLTEGSQLEVYPPGARQVSAGDKPLATLYVAEAGAVKSGCLVETGQLADIQVASRVKIAHLEPAAMRQRLVLDIDDETLRAEVETLLQDEQVAAFIQPAPPDQPAELRLQQVGDSLVLQDAGGQPLVAAFPPAKRHELRDDLIHLGRYRNTLKLVNPTAEAELAGALRLELKQLVLEGGAATTAPLELSAEGELEIETGQRIVIEVTNTADRPLYLAVFNFTHDWAIAQLYPQLRGAHEALEPGRSIHLGLSVRRQEQLTPTLPEGVSEAREFIKVIATLEETDFEVLELKSLKAPDQTRDVPLPGKRSALSALLEQAAQGSGLRALGAPPSTVADEWTTAELQFRLATDHSLSRSLPGGVPTSLPGFELTVEPPPGFTGRVRVLTARQQTRAAGGDLTDLQPPPGLAPFGRMFEPLEIPSAGRRGIGPGGAVIELEADDQARAAVTEATPLRLRLPEGLAGENDKMLVLAYDGSLFYPVGRPGDAANSLNVEWLPAAAPSDEAPTRSTRSLGRTVKLYLFKLAGWPEPSLGLHRARFVPAGDLATDPPTAEERSYPVAGGEARYRPLQAGDLPVGQRVALLVHGFTSETRWLVGGLLPWLEANGLGYDQVLTFDYETFNTRISPNGQSLATALRAAGFGPDDGLQLDVFAHSMGTQVVRSLVEQHGGEAFVDRCFLAGPPNQGTRLAEAKRLIPWLGTLLLNQAGPTPPSLIASWVLNKVSDDAVGGDDLRPGSEFYHLLNNADQPAKVPYYILAGRHDLPADYKSVWDRLAKTLVGAADAGLDLLFGDQHDLVINLQSMLKVRNGTYPVALLQTQVLPCHHFQYFGSPEGQAQLLAWLKPAS